MYPECYATSRIDKNTFLRAGLLLVWALGLALGFPAAGLHGDALAGCVQSAPAKAPAWFGLLAVNGLPLLISALAVFFHRPTLFAVAWLRGFALGSSLKAVSLAYPGAGVMVSGFLLFSSLAYAPVLLWYWCRAFTDSGDFRRDTLLCALAGMAVWAADLWIIAPLLREIVIL